MNESSDPKTKLEIRYSGGHAGNVYVGPKTKKEVMELFKRFLDLPLEGLGVRFEWVLSTEARALLVEEAEEEKPKEPEIIHCSCGETFDWEHWDRETWPMPKGIHEAVRHLDMGHTLMAPKVAKDD